MRNSLGWEDDANWEDFTHWLKDQFDTEIPEEEWPSINDVGDVYDAVMLHLPPGTEDCKCASAMAFYRLRQALGDLRRPRRLPPATPFAEVDPARLKTVLRGIGDNLHVPVARMGRRHRIIMAVTCFAALWFIVLAIGKAVPPHDESLGLMFTLLTVVLSGGSFLTMAGKRAPEDCATLGDLARRIAAYNYGRFVRLGARRSDDGVWDAVREALARFAKISKTEITRDTVFY